MQMVHVWYTTRRRITETTSLLRIIAEDTHYQNITRSKLYAHFQCATTLIFQPRARWLHLLKDWRRPDISEPREVVVPAASGSGHRWVQHGRLRPALVEVGNAGQPSDVRPEAWLDLPGLQLPPVDWFEPLVVLYLVAASRAAAQPLVGLFVQQLENGGDWECQLKSS